MQEIIKVLDIHKTYGTVEVLKGITFSVSRGEVLAITGASGAGKSTLLHIMGTLEKPDRGTVFFNNQRLNALREDELAKFRNRHIGFVFQFHHLLAEFSALENVCIPAFIAGKNKKEAYKRGTYLLELMGLADRFDHKPKKLSGGEQQRVAVARALMMDPDIILADEPSGNLDSASAASLHQLFFDLRSQLGKTFVIVTHNESLAAISDRRLRMQDGKLYE